MLPRQAHRMNKLLFILSVMVCGTQVFAQPLVEERNEFFEKRVRPLLVARCLECHSVDSDKSGGLSLDSKAGWATGGDSGAAIDLKEWQKSLLWVAVDYRNPKLQMPPDTKLTEQEKEVFRIWLSTGAYDPRELIAPQPAKKSSALAVEDSQNHWAYRSVMDSPVPSSHSEPSNGIDAFLFRSYLSVGVQPSQIASDGILHQRLSIDLHGMRQNVEELESAHGYEELVEAMLSSPRFGERFARHWMDAVRFAESITLRGFVLPDAWRYRSYLIDSFNQDKPVSEFIREQIAGDLLHSDSLLKRRSELIATTALAMGDTNLEEQDKKQLEMDYVDEQLDLIGKVFLAQTIGCARCHDHKFDPIPTRDYYALAGIMKSSVAMEHSNVSKWVSVPLPLDTVFESDYEAKSVRHAKAKKQLDALKKRIQSVPDSSAIVRLEDLEGIVVDDTSAKKTGIWKDSTSLKSYVGMGYLHDENSGQGLKSVTYEPADIKPGVYKVRFSYTHGSGRSTATVVRVFSADGEDVVRVNQVEKPSDDGLWQTLGSYRFEQGGQAFVIISNEKSDGHVVADAVQFLPENLSVVGSGSADKTVIDTDQNKEVSKSDVASMELLRKEAASLESELKSLQLELDSRPMVLSLRASDNPSDIPIHVRGSVHQLGSIVPRGFLSCISNATSTPTIGANANGRLELANWLVSDTNPLTARVYVNRVWSWLMGDGIVRTVDNFGTTGEQPSNLELLDWLTIRFIQNGWSTKWLVREIVLSDAYKRSSQCSTALRELDPDNRLFARSSLRRLDVESIRDTLLGASGELDLGVQIESTIPGKLKEDYGFQHFVRYRSVYGPWFRNALPELYSEFDGANPSFSISKRNRSTIAQQALALLNSDWIAQRATKFGELVFKQSNLSDDEKICYCFKTLLSRLPSEREVTWAQEYLRQSRGNTSFDERVWGSLSRSIIASIGFRYVE